MQEELLTDKCYAILKQEINHGKYLPDDWIAENDVCKEQGVSKATAREVLHRLTQEGILESYPRRGYQLKVYDETDFERIGQLRFVIESLVVHRVIEDVSPQKVRELLERLGQYDNHTFHLELARLCEDPFLTDTLDNLLTKTDSTYSYMRYRAGGQMTLDNRHRELLSAILEKNEKKAITVLRGDLHLNEADLLLDGEGLWKGSMGFTTDRMGEMVYLSDPQISPDGQWAMVVKYKAREEDGCFYPRTVLVNLKTFEEVLIADENIRHPGFLPDGRIVYLSDRSGEYQIYLDARQITTLRHGVKTFSFGTANTEGEPAFLFCFEADLWKDEIESNIAFTEMTAEEKADWLERKEWAPIEITEIDYKRDECKGVRDGSISCIGLAEVYEEAGSIGTSDSYPGENTGSYPTETTGFEGNVLPDAYSSSGYSSFAKKRSENVSVSQRLLSSEIPCHMPVLSPDGTKIACYGQVYTGPFYSTEELVVFDLVSGERSQLTSDKNLSADVPVCFTADSEEIVYPFYYEEEGCVIGWLNRIPVGGGDTVCLFESDMGSVHTPYPSAQAGCGESRINSLPGSVHKSETVSSGTASLPSCRTQYGTEKSYFTVSGDWVYFLGFQNGMERLYRISLKGDSVPEPVIEGDFSIHEFCLPVPVKESAKACGFMADDKNQTGQALQKLAVDTAASDEWFLVTRGDYVTLRDLYLYNSRTKEFTRVMDSNAWLSECTLGRTVEMDVSTADQKAVVHGRVCLPIRYVEGQKYPAVLYIHGGPTCCYSNDFWHEIQILANAGYVVITCDPRGSSGYGLQFSNSEDAWGEEADQDLMGFLDAVIARGYADPDRVGIT
ncbi:MAG: prolyl oligopeptidase family serine peptidase, partial [Lachnospiraceae bacterium]|nr:prolyl oligopeptidase family serine peptidase [Lachnospiraceae bacterium]